MNQFILDALVIALVIQLIFFIFAAIRKTDVVTDLSYGLTFVLIAIWALLKTNLELPSILLTAVITIWGVRLAGFLFMRIRKLKIDARFNGIREDFWKFARFWLLQGVSVWVIMIAATLFYSKNVTSDSFNGLSYIPLSIALLGILIESTADQQKFKFKNDPANKGHWTDVGLYKYSRHPNYFGEMLMWWGIFGFTASTLVGAEWLVIISPVYITALLLFVTGIPTTEKRNDQVYKGNKEYEEYKKKTGLVLPKF